MPAEADEADAEANEADKVILIGETTVADDTDEADKAIEAANEADVSDEPGKADVADATDAIFLPFSLTKYSSTFAEVKGYFGIEFYVGCVCSLRMQDRNKIDNQLATALLGKGINSR